MTLTTQHIAKQSTGRSHAPAAVLRVGGAESMSGRVKRSLKPLAAIVPFTVLAACQMDQANEAMRGMSQDRMVVARAAFKEMDTEELAGMLLLSKDIAESCDGIETHGQVQTFLSSRVERQPFSDPQVNRTRLDAALSDFAMRQGITDPADEKVFCAAARAEMKAMTPLGATLTEGRVH